MPTTANTINYYVAADGTLRDGLQGSIAQTPRINYGTEYAVTLSFPASTIAEGDQLQVALNRTRTFFSSASATGDAPVAAVAKHDVTAEEAAAQAVTLTLSTNTRAMIDQVNGIDHPVRGFFGVHVLRGQSFVTLAVADALMMSLESGPDAISPPLPILDYPTRQEMNDAVHAAETAAENAQTSEDNAETYADNAEDEAQAARTAATAAANSATLAESYAHGGTGTRPGEDTDNAKYYLEQLGDHEAQAKEAAQAAAGSATVAAGFARDAATAAGNAAGSATQAGQAATAATTAKNAAETAQGLAETAQGKAEQAQAKAEQAQGAAEAAQTASETAQGKAEDAQTAAETAQEKAEDAQDAAEDARDAAVTAKNAAETAQANAAKIAEGTDADVEPLGLEHSAKGWAEEAAERMTVVTIPAATTTYTLLDNKHYQQVPSAVPTYTLPVATFDGLVHEITVLVDFMHVTSCSFVDDSGVPVTLQSAISPQIGEAYIFRCYWYGKWRVVPMKIRNAATVSSATGVVEVSDAVAGDALALKMVAPRSVVVNQLVQNGDFSNGTTNWNGFRFTITAQDNVLTGVLNTGSLQYMSLNQTLLQVIPASHVALIHVEIKIPYNDNAVIRLGAGDGGTFYSSQNIACIANTWGVLNVKTNALSDIGKVLFIYPSNTNYASWQIDDAIQMRNVQVVDLTQYFNGDQTLIDSIQSWDDLVAYDPRFASYVEYNTGEVAGVQPTVKVSGKNLFDAENAPLIYQSFVSDYSVARDSSGIAFTYYQGSLGFCLFKLFEVTPYTVGTYTCKINVAQNGLVPDATNLFDASTIVSGKQDGTDRADIPNIIRVTESDNKTMTFTITSSLIGKVVSLRLYVNNANSYLSNGDVVTFSNIQLELGSIATSYEPYHDGGTAQAPAPLFAVGNAADEYEAVSGVTTAKTAMFAVPSTGWSEYTNGVWSGFRCDQVLPEAMSRAAYISSNPVFVSMVSGGATHNAIHFWLGINNTYLYAIWDSTVVSGLSAWYVNGELSASAFMTWLASNPVTLRYVQNIPTTSQSTPTQISLQAGSNTAMQTDGGRTLAELAMIYENLPSES